MIVLKEKINLFPVQEIVKQQIKRFFVFGGLYQATFFSTVGVPDFSGHRIRY